MGEFGLWLSAVTMHSATVKCAIGTVRVILHLNFRGEELRMFSKGIRPLRLGICAHQGTGRAGVGGGPMSRGSCSVQRSCTRKDVDAGACLAVRAYLGT